MLCLGTGSLPRAWASMQKLAILSLVHNNVSGVCAALLCHTPASQTQPCFQLLPGMYREEHAYPMCSSNLEALQLNRNQLTGKPTAAGPFCAH